MSRGHLTTALQVALASRCGCRQLASRSRNPSAQNRCDRQNVTSQPNEPSSGMRELKRTKGDFHGDGGWRNGGQKKGRHGCVVKPFRGHLMDGDAPSHQATTTKVQVQNLLALSSSAWHECAEKGRRTLSTAERDRIPFAPSCLSAPSRRSPFVRADTNLESDSCFMSWLVTSPAAL
jgi:hypothetical protein